MRRLIYIAIFLLSSSSLNAQTSFKEVDSTSFALYANKNWGPLVEYGEKAIKNGLGYFYLNVRVGIAYFNLKEYKKSNLYLKRAHEMNSYNNVVLEYLFWNNYHLLKEKEALKWYSRLDDSIQKRIDYKPLKTVTSTYLEGGKKISNKPTTAGNINYFNAALQLHLSGRFNLLQSYTYSDQKLNWGSFNQHQYYINPSYLLNKSLKVNIGVHLAQYKSQLDYHWEGEYQSTTSSSVTTSVSNPFPYPGSSMTTITTVIDTFVNAKYDILGTYLENDILIQPRITKQWKIVTLSPYFSYYYSSQNPNYSEIIIDTTEVIVTEEQTVINQDTTIIDNISTPQNSYYQQLGFGSSIKFNYKFINVGVDARIILKNEKKLFFFSPSLKVDLGKKVHFSSYYFKKTAYVVGLFEGSQLINSFDNVQKTSFTTSFDLSKTISLYLTYQNEKILDRLNLKEYKLNSFYLGLKLNL